MIAMVQSADEPFSLFGYGSNSFILRPLIGIITKMINAGCERIFLVNNVTGEGIDELKEYLEEDLPQISLEEAKYRQSLGLNEWEPLPEN